MKILGSFFVSVLILVVLAAPAMAHNGMEDIGTTLRDIGRGGAFIATEPDAGAMNGNPAAIAMIRNPEFYFDIRGLFPDLGYEGALNASSQKEGYLVPNFGYIAPIQPGMVWGLGFYSVGGMGAVFNDYDLSLLGLPEGTTDRTSSQVQYGVLTPTFAMMLNEDTSFGLGFNYGQVNVKYNFFGDTIGHQVTGLNGWGHGWRAGLYHKADEDTTIGAYYRTRSFLDLGGGTMTVGPFAEMGANAVIPGTTMEGFNFPEQFGIGIGHQFDDEWTGFFEWRRLLWNGSVDFVRVVPPEGMAAEFLMDWNDQNVFVLGTEYRPDGTDDEIWRFGFNYASSAVPDSTVNVLFPAVTETHYTVGYETALSDDVSMVTALNYVPRVSQTSTADSPYNDFFGLQQPFSASHGSWEFGIGFNWEFGGGAPDMDGASDNGAGDEGLSEEGG